MTSGRQATGRGGEDMAAVHLKRKGYRILCRNYRCPVGELDIVAESGDTVVFVEVRTRRSPCAVRPEETVNRAKAGRVVRAAEHYLAAARRDDSPWRVDVVAVEIDSGGALTRLDHYEDALADVMRIP